MNRTNAAVAVVLFLLLAGSAWGVPYVAGPYTVDVVVRNTTMALIPDADVSCWLDGKVIRLKASARGYVSKTAAIQTGAATYYKYDFVLEDPELRVAIVDLNGRPIKSAYLEKGQYGFAGNEYGFTVYIPKQVWPMPAQKRVEIIDGFLGAAWKLWAKLEKIEDYYRVKVAMDRKAIFWGGPEFYVVFDLSKKVAPSATHQWVERLARLEVDPLAPAGAAAALGAFLAEPIMLPDVIALGLPVPRTLQAYHDQAARFAELHRDTPQEN